MADAMIRTQSLIPRMIVTTMDFARQWVQRRRFGAMKLRLV